MAGASLPSQDTENEGEAAATATDLAAVQAAERVLVTAAETAATASGTSVTATGVAVTASRSDVAGRGTAGTVSRPDVAGGGTAGTASSLDVASEGTTFRASRSDVSGGGTAGPASRSDVAGEGTAGTASRSASTSTAAAAASIFQVILDELECPVCLELMVSSAGRQPLSCINGHSVCASCVPRLLCCPSCRSEEWWGRCRVLETLATTLNNLQLLPPQQPAKSPAPATPSYRVTGRGRGRGRNGSRRPPSSLFRSSPALSTSTPLRLPLTHISPPDQPHHRRPWPREISLTSATPTSLLPSPSSLAPSPSSLVPSPSSIDPSSPYLVPSPSSLVSSPSSLVPSQTSLVHSPCALPPSAPSALIPTSTSSSLLPASSYLHSFINFLNPVYSPTTPIQAQASHSTHSRSSNHSILVSSHPSLIPSPSTSGHQGWWPPVHGRGRQWSRGRSLSARNSNRESSATQPAHRVFTTRGRSRGRESQHRQRAQEDRSEDIEDMERFMWISSLRTIERPLATTTHRYEWMSSNLREVDRFQPSTLRQRQLSAAQPYSQQDSHQQLHTVEQNSQQQLLTAEQDNYQQLHTVEQDSQQQLQTAEQDSQLYYE